MKELGKVGGGDPGDVSTICVGGLILWVNERLQGIYGQVPHLCPGDSVVNLLSVCVVEIMITLFDLVLGNPRVFLVQFVDVGLGTVQKVDLCLPGG